MNLKLIVILFFSFFLSLAMFIPSANAQGILHDRSSLDLDLSISSRINIVPDSEQSEVEYVIANLLFFPRNDENQIVMSTQVDPDASVNNAGIIFEWLKPKKRTLDYSFRSNVHITDSTKRVTEKTTFPAHVPSEHIKYTLPTSVIDSGDDLVRKKALELAEGEDDLFVVLFKLASWVEENIQYDLSTLTADVSQPASWVLRNRVGVCDEMTSLFIAMSRGLGIPARFVSGVSYTTSSSFEENWLPHGWAEVYVDGAGWVSFDPTFQQFGYVDATHIKLSESIDPTEPASKFEWVGNANLEPEELEFDVVVRKTGDKVKPRTIFKSFAARESVAIGSFQIITTQIENLRQEYTATTLYLTTSSEAEAKVSKQHVLLKPGETKKVHWILRVSDDLPQDYVYTIPILISDNRNASEGLDFIVEERSIFLDEAEAESLAVFQDDQSSDSLVQLRCDVSSASVTLNSELEVLCSVKNRMNSIIDGDFCFDSNCKPMNLQIDEEKSISETMIMKEVGRGEVKVQLIGNKRRTLFLPYEVFDSPDISIANVEISPTVSFSDTGELSFMLTRSSYSIPVDLVVIVNHQGINHRLNLESLAGQQGITLQFFGKQLVEGKNIIPIIVRWRSSDGQEFETNAEAIVAVEEFSVWQKFAGWFSRIFS
jgi:transglutaminase-like putative cysteine protease